MFPLNRRSFLSGSLAATAAGLSEFAFLHGLPQVSAEEVRDASKLVQLQADIEPLVRLIETTDSNKLLERIAEKIRTGTSYQQLLAAVMLAGVRGIQPRPVGFKFHAVLVINSAQLASLDAEDNDRWLPLFWALDNFKDSQARNAREGDWHMTPVAEGKLPSATQAPKRFVEAMQNWDESGADVAVSALARTAGAAEVMELIWPLACRDFRSIGHKAIYAANGYRTLQTIGWRHAEPVLRSLAYAMLAHGDDPNPAKSDLEADRPGRENLEKAKSIRKGWQAGTVRKEATLDLLATLRSATPSESASKVVKLLNEETDPASIWDGLFLGAGELLMRQPGIVGLHCVTTMNALHYAYQTSGVDSTRKLVMLQGASFLPMFQRAMRGRGKVGTSRLDQLEPLAIPQGKNVQPLDTIFENVSKNRTTAAQQTLSYLQNAPAGAQAMLKEARRLIFTKGRDSHDYKFSSAALEDYFHVTPTFRDRFLASSTFNLKGANDRDNRLIERTRAALEG